MSINFKLFLKRFLIFQFAFLFIFSKIIKLEKSIKDLSKRLKYIAKNSQYSEETLKSIELKSPKIFMIIYSTYFLFSFLALMNIGLAKQLTGIMTIFMALIYCNPLSTIKKKYGKKQLSRRLENIYSIIGILYNILFRIRHDIKCFLFY